MMERAQTCTFTGHRENKLPWGENENDPRCLRLKERIYDAAEAAYRAGARHFLCGMARGCDLFFCEAVQQLRGEHPEITVEAAIPFEGQAKAWPERQKRRWERLVTDCDYQTVVQRDYTPSCMQRRNEYMVDASGTLIAAYNGAPGGTRNTLLYAMRAGLNIIELPMEE